MCQKLHHSRAHSHARQSRRNFFATMIPAAVLAPNAFPQSSGDMGERFRRMSMDAETKGTGRAVQRDHGKRHGRARALRDPLHRRLHRPVRKAAEAFLSALTPEQRARRRSPVDDPGWRKWMNQHFYVRQGVSFKEMSDAQREAAFGLMRARSAPAA